MSDAVMSFGVLALIALCGYYSDEIARRLWKPKTPVMCQEWRDLVAPIVKKCRLSATFNGCTRFDTDGSAALASLLERMATELDRRS